jgi:hypothetical protein
LNRGAEWLGVAFGFLNRALGCHFGIAVGSAHFFFKPADGPMDESSDLVVIVFLI